MKFKNIFQNYLFIIQFINYMLNEIWICVTVTPVHIDFQYEMR